MGYTTNWDHMKYDECKGATSVLKIRDIYLNHHWDQFLEHVIKTEQNQLFANAA